MSRWGLFLPVAALVCAIDQASKWWIVKHMTLESVITVVPGFFDIVSVRNRGAAFGFLSGSGQANGGKQNQHQDNPFFHCQISSLFFLRSIFC